MHLQGPDVHARGHGGAVHEFGQFGHIALGLDDEYIDDGSRGERRAATADTPVGHQELARRALRNPTLVLPRGTDNRIMSYGDEVRPEHYAPFIETLRAVTERGGLARDDWAFHRAPTGAR